MKLIQSVTTPIALRPAQKAEDNRSESTCVLYRLPKLGVGYCSFALATSDGKTVLTTPF